MLPDWQKAMLKKGKKETSSLVVNELICIITKKMSVSITSIISTVFYMCNNSCLTFSHHVHKRLLTLIFLFCSMIFLQQGALRKCDSFLCKAVRIIRG